MIVAFSTSSPWASVALLEPSGGLIWSACEHVPHRASGTCLAQLERGLKETGRSLSESSLFMADLGPGSFTGVRVGIVLAKTLGYVHGKPCAGADSFDLINPTGVVVLPSRKGEYFVRRPGHAAVRGHELPDCEFSGYAFGGEDTPPQASGFRLLLDRLEIVEAEALVPAYLMDPSISIPKKPYRGVPSV